MTSIELQLCDIQGRLFKLSAQRGINSAEFIKVFMKSATAKALDSTYNRMQWAGEEYLLEEVIDEAANRLKKPGKEIIKLAPVKVIKQDYERLYKMTPEEDIEILKGMN